MSQTNETTILTSELQKMPLWAKNLALIFGASLILGLCARVSIPLPFTPIPITIQNSLVLLMGVLLGSRRAACAVAAFLTQGALGFSFFSGGAYGLSVLFGPKGGYLFGYLLAAFAVGKLMELSGKRTFWNAFFAMSIGNGVIYLLGAAVLSLTIGGVKAIALGVLPFLLGDVAKILLSLKFLQYVGWEQK